MARRSARTQDHDNAERWLLTYADMITLLMAFFIMLYSMSQLDLKKFDAMTGAVQAQLGGSGVLKGSVSVTQAPGKHTGVPGIMPTAGGGGQRALKQALADRLQPLVGGLRISSDGDGVKVTLPATRLYFAPGSATPTTAMLRALQALAETLAGGAAGPPGSFTVRVVGHTCNLPVHNGSYDSNWELSTDRARNVAFRLIRYGAVRAQDCSVMGLADTQPAFPNDTEERRARNRRVEISIQPRPDAHGARAGATPAVSAPPSPAAAESQLDIRPDLRSQVATRREATQRAHK